MILAVETGTMVIAEMVEMGMAEMKIIMRMITMMINNRNDNI